MENTKEKHHGKHSLKGSPICLRRCFKLFNPATHFTTPEISSDLFRYHQLHRLPEGFLFQSLIYPVRKAKQSRDFFQRADVMEHFGSWTAPAWTNPESWKHLWTFAPFQQDFL